MGVVGSRARAGSTARSLAIPVAGAVCLSAGYRRFSLHRRHARGDDRMAFNEVISPIPKFPADLADGVWRCAGLRTLRAGVARDLRLPPRFRARSPAEFRALAMACSAIGVARAYSSMLDSEVGRLFHALDTALGDRVGLRPRAAARSYRRIMDQTCYACSSARSEFS